MQPLTPLLNADTNALILALESNKIAGEELAAALSPVVHCRDSASDPATDCAGPYLRRPRRRPLSSPTRPPFLPPDRRGHGCLRERGAPV